MVEVCKKGAPKGMKSSPPLLCEGCGKYIEKKSNLFYPFLAAIQIIAIMFQSAFLKFKTILATKAFLKKYTNWQ
ncbi:MAG: hypothetical protein COA50_07425 [Flavobacteriaceae bacterium]|nr:MAG: hypothetical protein COA50_07425 [Flavobacteriaceae bacterium]